MTYAEVVAALRAAGCVFAEDEALLLIDAFATPELPAAVVRRCGGEPLEQVVGWASFCGLRVRVAPGVFVPRKRTELLARTAAGLARSGDVVVDLCCGSGAIGVAVRASGPGVEVYAADLLPSAVACALVNLGERVYEGDLFDALPATLAGRVSVLLANAPYVPTPAIPLMPAEARDHEPQPTLDGGHDGLDVVRRIVAGAPAWLAPGGSVLFECSDEQLPAALTACAPLRPRVVQDDRGGTVVIGQR